MKFKTGKYSFMAYTLTNCGYHQPDHCVWWEAVDKDGLAVAHANTMRELEFILVEEVCRKKYEEKIAILEKALKDIGRFCAMSPFPMAGCDFAVHTSEDALEKAGRVK